MPSYNFLLNSSNNLNFQNNVYQYKFPNGSFNIDKDSKISLKSMTIPYSWYNISASYGNNTFSYTMPTSGTNTNTVSVTLPDGFYTITDLNNALSASLKANGYFFYSTANGVSNAPYIIYPIQFSSQVTNYTNSIIFQYIPTSAANVSTQFGSSYLWALGTYPTTAQTPTITIPQQAGSNISATSYGLGNILGFLNGIYPPTASTYSGTPTIYNSQAYTVLGNTLKTSTNNQITAYPPFAPLGSLVNAIIVRCNLVNNPISSNGISDVLDTFPINSTFGGNINFEAKIDNSVSIAAGKYTSLQISLFDQNYNPLNVQDINLLISLRITTP